MRKPLLVTTFTLLATLAAGPSHGAGDDDVPEYQPVSGISGGLSSVGSDTLANLMTLWAEQFKKIYPSVNIQVQAAGSSTAPPALIEGTSNLGPMSRKMKDKEIASFEQRFGYKPTEIRVSIDALSVYVHKDNPVTGLNMEQVDAIFSSTRTCGGSRDLTRWSDLGVGGALANQSIQLFGRNSVSGTYGYFKEKALCKGDFKTNVNEQPGSASVVQSVSSSLNGIGYSGIGYKTSEVRAVPIAKGSGDDYIEALPEMAIRGEYPLARFLYIYVNRTPNRPLPPLEAEFIKLVLSRDGQQMVVKDGYIPLPTKVVQGERRRLGLN